MNNYYKLLAAIILVGSIFLTGFIHLGKGSIWTPVSFRSPLGNFKFWPPPAKEKPLAKYSFENLRRYVSAGSQISLEKVIKEEKEFTSYLFSFFSQGKKITGQANIPRVRGLNPILGFNPAEKLPVIVMLRGYIDKENYQTGDGTRKAASFFARNGFLTLAPDFLGFGGSDSAEADPIKSRFETYLTAINLISSVGSLDGADPSQIFIWGHSNGGQIALSLLEITGLNLPITLWAPVSKPFPYSVLFYSDEASDSGKMLRRVVAKFEEDYDADLYSLTNYLDWIKAPVQIHQGTLDEAVPRRWSKSLVKRFKELEKEVQYFEYLGDDHNFAQGSWPTVVARDLKFFQSYLSR